MARASETVRFGRLHELANSTPFAKLSGPNALDDDDVRARSPGSMSRSDWSKPRIIAVMPTIDVMPMTTPSTVSPERILLRAHGVERHRDDFAEQTDADRHARYSFLSASIGSSRAARDAG